MKRSVSFKIIMTTSVTRPCITTQHSTPDLQDQDRFFWSQTSFVLRPTISDHITGDNNWSYKTANSSQIVITNNPSFLPAGSASCLPTNSFKALRGKRLQKLLCLYQWRSKMEKQSKFLLRLLLVITAESTCQSVRPAMRRPGVEAAACWSQVQRPNHYSTGTQPVNVLILRSNIGTLMFSMQSTLSTRLSQYTVTTILSTLFKHTQRSLYLYIDHLKGTNKL